MALSHQWTGANQCLVDTPIIPKLSIMCDQISGSKVPFKDSDSIVQKSLNWTVSILCLDADYYRDINNSL